MEPELAPQLSRETTRRRQSRQPTTTTRTDQTSDMDVATTLQHDTPPKAVSVDDKLSWMMYSSELHILSTHAAWKEQLQHTHTSQLNKLVTLMPGYIQTSKTYATTPEIWYTNS